MIKVVKFEPKHWEEIQAQETTAYLGQFVTSEHMEILATNPHSYTGFSNGRIVAIAGVVEHWPGRGEAWAELAQVCKKEFLAIHNAVKRFLDVSPFERIEATVDCEFKAAHRWIKLLGFELEAPRMKKYSPDGKDYSLYARVK